MWNRLWPVVIAALALHERAPAIAADALGYLGVVFARDSADLAAQSPATVREVRVRLGDPVKRGQVVAILESPELQQDVAAARAGLWAARADSARAAAELDQVAQLYERRERAKDVFTPEELETMKARRTAIAASLEQASAIVAERTANLRAFVERQQALEVRAPFSGKVAAVDADPGDYVAAGTSVVRVVSASDSWVRFAVPASESSWLSPGCAVDVGVGDATSRLRCEVRQVSPEVESITGMVFAEAEVVGAAPPLARLPVGTVVRVFPAAR
jgi:RND family efflux transporter MFP subunit